ncbi:ciliary basal body-associated [Diplonema papillatum]|nr:ciliary basal body-associated [Diplonema papillatum]
MPGELHIIGQLSHATNFSKKNLFVLWEAVTGSHWEHIEGNEQGQTHILEDSGGPAGAVFAHPIDLHYKTQNIQGWPKLVVHVWHQDDYGRKDFVSYGVAYLPCHTSGFSDELVEVQTWSPTPPTLYGRMRELLLGGTSQLKDDNLVHRMENRFRLQSAPSGQVFFKLSLMSQHFDRFSVTGV